MGKATFRAYANIAFIKYWGAKDKSLNLPYTNSLSMTLSGAHSTTTVAWLATSQREDEISLNGQFAKGTDRTRIIAHLDRMRNLLGHHRMAKVVSVNNFPAGAGIASSASGFCALTVAAAAASQMEGEDLDLNALARISRRASGSACRSFFGGFVEWEAGIDDCSSLPMQLHHERHWALNDVVAVVSRASKKVSSQSGHGLADSSFLLENRLQFVSEALPIAKGAVRSRNLKILGPLLEKDALFMHAVMLTSRPSLLYLNDAAVDLMQAVQSWRAEEGLEAYFTIDAGPNLHVICEEQDRGRLLKKMEAVESVSQIIVNRPGPGPEPHPEHLF